MIAASYNAQRWNPAGAGEPLTRRHGMPGSVIAHNQSQFPARSPDLLPLRANWQAFTGLPLYSSVTLRSLPVERHRRLVHPLPSGRAATNSRGRSSAFSATSRRLDRPRTSRRESGTPPCGWAGNSAARGRSGTATSGHPSNQKNCGGSRRSRGLNTADRNSGASTPSSATRTLSLWAVIRIFIGRSLLRFARSLALWIAPELATEPGNHEKQETSE